MKHLKTITCTVPVALASTSLSLKLDAILSIVDSTGTAMRQAAWGIKPGGIGGSTDTDTGTDTGGTDTGGTDTTTE